MTTTGIILGFLLWIAACAALTFAYAFFRVNFTKTGRARYALYEQGRITRDQL